MPVEVNTMFLTGSLLAAERALEQIVDEHYPFGAAFKVGQSVRPPNRILGVGPASMEGYFSQPRAYGLKNPTYRYELSAIYFLYTTDKYPDCQNAERALITKLNLYAESRSLNLIGGGGGKIAASGPYFVYLVRSP
jgi:hypothetical protein